MARREYLEYVWNKMIRPQIGYSFSIPHDIAYSIEAVQEANLATRYNPLFWACARPFSVCHNGRSRVHQTHSPNVCGSTWRGKCSNASYGRRRTRKSYRSVCPFPQQYQ